MLRILLDNEQRSINCKEAATMDEKVAIGEEMDVINAQMDKQLLSGVMEFKDTPLSILIASDNLFMLEYNFKTFESAVDILG